MYFKKFIATLILLVFTAIPVKAQLDLEHWFPPFHIPKSYTPIPKIANLYISTPHQEEFKIRIYGGKDFLYETTISKDKPLIYSLPFNKTFVSANLAMKVVDAGIYVAGEKSFFADIRISLSDNYTEFITSKGKSALGNDFKNANPPISLYEAYQTLNMQTSIMAYHDNTKVKIFGYSNKINFSDKSNSKIIEFTLNKGESYVTSILKRDNYDLHDNEYINTFLGATIASDKPIIVNNGGINGTGSFEGGNIMYDQSMPIKNIGKEYYFQKGKSDLRKGIEKALIIATENNTEIYLNGETQPIATINKGMFYLVQSKNFVNNGVYIKTSKPSYVYQIMSGSNKFQDKVDYSFLSYGYALVLPIDHHKSGNIDALQKLNLIDNHNFETDLLIISEKNKNTKLNDGDISQSSGPFAIAGNNSIEYFLVKGFSGNAKITSDGNLVAGITAGMPIFAGHAGYYTSFSNDPFITKNGNCIQESVILSISNTDFDTIQWQKDGVDIAGANSSTYIPTTPGNYRCKLIYSYGEFNFITNEIYVDNCPFKISEQRLENFCTNQNYIISPQFSPPNTKYDVVKTEIITQPYQGEAKLNGTDITVKMFNNFSGENRIVFKITAANGFYEIINGKFKVYEIPENNIISPIDPIGIDKNKYIYNLTNSLLGYTITGKTFLFYNSEVDAINKKNEIKTPNNYITLQKSVFIRITNANNCFIIIEINLNQPSLPPNPEPNNSEFTNTFTPNNDGINDTWSFESLANYQDLEIIIYNKQGKMVYQYTQGKPFFWDGNDSFGRKLPSDTYWVILKGLNIEKNELLNKSMWIYLKNR